MCTVTLFPTPGFPKGFVLNSNMDEAVDRKAFPPDVYLIEGVKMIFPKDSTAGGTWIGVSEHSRLICLLNGAFEAHKRKPSYRKSRGAVVTDLLAEADIDTVLEHYFLKEIEPFTIILVDWKLKLRFIEFVWDGEIRYITSLPLKPHIWSSSPLYNKEMRQKRLEWFENLLEGEMSSENILDFHHHGGEGSMETNLIMDRGFVKTHSITQVENFSGNTRMLYEDLLSGKTTEIHI